MKKMPRTPFSTSLSGSAKETEIRIRNIFSGPKKRPPIPLMALTVLMILLCGNIVSCQQRSPEPTLVMETQYYDSYANYLEIPMLALPAGEENEAVEAINAGLAQLGEEYAFVKDNLGVSSQCTLYPSTTDRYISLVFFENDSSYGNDGYVRSWVYDKKEGTQVTQEDALALADTAEEELCSALEELIAADPEDPRGMYEPADIVGFRIKADGKPVFYLSAFVDETARENQVVWEEWDRLYIWEDGTFSRYSCMVFGGVEQYPLVPAEETDKLDPPLWNQWYFAGEQPVGGFVDKPALDTLQYETQLNKMALEYLQAAHNAPAYLPADIPDTPQEGDCRLDFAACLGTDTLDGELLGLYQIDYSRYQQRSGELSWLEWFPAYLVARMDESRNGFLVRFDYYQEGMSPGDAIRQAVWGLTDLEVCLFRDGDSRPIGIGSWMILFPELEEEVVVHRDWEPTYQPGDYWDEWSVGGGGEAGGVSAHRYHNAAEGTLHVQQLETGRTDMYTPRGIRVGSTREEVLAAYPGLLSDEKDWQWAYPDDYLWYCADENGFGPHLYFYFVNDVVYMIQMVDIFD